MKKLRLSALLIILVLLLSFSYKINKLWLITGLDKFPNLPQQEFYYGLDSLPDHMLSSAELEIDDSKATLGRVLFYDNLLSSTESISCATCHIQKFSFADGKKVSEGISGPTKRNSMHLNALVWDSPRFFTWDMEPESLSDMLSLPLNDSNELGIDMEQLATKMFNTLYYPALFQSAYQHPVATEEKIIDALQHFIFSITSAESKFDKGLNNNFEEFTASELLGLDIFGRHCGSCHFDGTFYYLNRNQNTNGLPLDPNDLGAGEWDEELEGLFKTTTLRNIEVTGPYMHDGRFATLEEVVDHYSDSVQVSSNHLLPGPLNFNTVQKKSLVDYMKTLTDQNLLTNEKWSDPFLLPTNTNDQLEQIAFSFTPNPTQDAVTIKLHEFSSQAKQIRLLSPSGQPLIEKETISDSVTLSLENFSPGVYFLQVRVGDQYVTKKLIIF